MNRDTDQAGTASDVSESMTEVSELMADLSESIEQAADRFTAFSETMEQAADGFGDNTARSRSSGFAAADD